MTTNPQQYRPEQHSDRIDSSIALRIIPDGDLCIACRTIIFARQYRCGNLSKAKRFHRDDLSTQLCYEGRYSDEYELAAGR